MSKFQLDLSYKNCCILKHSLRDKVQMKEENIRVSDANYVSYTEDLTNEEYLKELEEEKRALAAITEEIDMEKARKWHMH
ncbi:hypothetical protein [Clostridium sp.]|uniref:hypothetical protein n=1 Tax=Clostridium sp. TaxID=1506 RepID=UPI003217C1FF